jgi:hypothetical protein
MTVKYNPEFPEYILPQNFKMEMDGNGWEWMGMDGNL